MYSIDEVKRLSVKCELVILYNINTTLVMPEGLFLSLAFYVYCRTSLCCLTNKLIISTALIININVNRAIKLQYKQPRIDRETYFW